MWYTYVLYSLKSKRKYIGSSDNLRQRVIDHNNGLGGMYTKKHKPFKLVFYEAFLSKHDALKQEQFFKTGYGREVLNKKIENSLKVVSGVI